ncbi:MAG: hypothetical protein ABSE73_01450 [Planctomycetota bacterium]
MAARKRNPLPLGGIWYYLWLRPTWHLCFVTDERVQHMTYWPRVVVPKLQEHYNLSPVEVRSLFVLYAAMPRGRIVSQLYGKEWILAHGGDFPHGLDPDSEIDRLIKQFNLRGQRTTGKLEIVVHEHEMMIPRHKRAIQKIIGKVPY